VALRWLSGSGRCLGPAPPRIRAREKHRSDRRWGPWPRSQQMDSGGVARRFPTLSRAFFTCVAHRARSAVALDPCGSKLEEPSSGLHECTFGRQRNRMNRQPGRNNELVSGLRHGARLCRREPMAWLRVRCPRRATDPCDGSSSGPEESGDPNFGTQVDARVRCSARRSVDEQRRAG
jgi:hypothetical protein